MKTTTLSTTAALAALGVLCFSAPPVVESKPLRPFSGSVPLARRSERFLTREDGQIDWDKTQRHLAALFVKYQNGVANYQLAHGKPLLGSRSLSKEELEAHLRKRSEVVYDDYYDAEADADAGDDDQEDGGDGDEEEEEDVEEPVEDDVEDVEDDGEEEEDVQVDASLVQDADVEEDGADDLTYDEMMGGPSSDSSSGDDTRNSNSVSSSSNDDDDEDANDNGVDDDEEEEAPTVEAAFSTNSDELSGDPQALPPVKFGSWKARRSIALDTPAILATKKKASSGKAKKPAAPKKTSKGGGKKAAGAGKQRGSTAGSTAGSSGTNNAPAPSGAGSGGALGLTNYMQGLLWYGQISVGTPAKTFNLDFDTGSADMWIPAAACSSCGNHNRYYPTSSSTSSTQSGSTFSITYGDGSTTGGKVYKDTVGIAGLSVTGQSFGAAASLASGFKNDPMDGILGMGYQSLSSMGASPVFATMMGQNKVANRIFSFKLADSGSHLYLGGADSSSYTGAFEWYPLVSESYWVITGSVKAGGKTAVSNFNAIIDTGTTVIVAPTAAAQAFWASVPGAQAYGSGYYTYPCNSPPQVAFNFGGRDWTMSAATLNQGAVGNSGRCLGAIIGMDIGLDAWIVGGSFLQSVYSSFDMGSNRVGFAALA